MKRLALVILLLLVPFASEGAAPRSLCKISHPSDAQIEWECRRLKKGETLEGLFSDKWKDVVRFNRMDRRHVYPGLSIKVPKRIENIKDFMPMPTFYKLAESDEPLRAISRRL